MPTKITWTYLPDTDPGYCFQDPVEVLGKIHDRFPVISYKGMNFYDFEQQVFGFRIHDSEEYDRIHLGVTRPMRDFGLSITASLDDLIPRMEWLCREELKSRYSVLNASGWRKTLKKIIDLEISHSNGSKNKLMTVCSNKIILEIAVATLAIKDSYELMKVYEQTRGGYDG
jgi:hypothetical protein